MDISRFDFELDELVALIPRLNELAQVIELEPRLHGEDEGDAAHPRRTEPTYRISCQLRGVDGTVRRLADIAIETGVEAVLDFGRSVRFRHLNSAESPSPQGDPQGA